VCGEKPLALSYPDGRALAAFALETQRTLFVDETFLYDPLLQQARDLIAPVNSEKSFMSRSNAQAWDASDATQMSVNSAP